jgi:hypothetical protein
LRAARLAAGPEGTASTQTEFAAGAAAGEVDLAGLAEQVTEQGREISALARTIARMRRRLEDEGILVAETAEEGAGRRADAM